MTYDCVCELGDNPNTVPVETNFGVDCSVEDDGSGAVSITITAKDDNGNQSPSETYDIDDNINPN